MAEVVNAPLMGASPARSDGPVKRTTFADRATLALPSIGVFLGATLEYLVARSLFDYFDQYVFRLTSRPFCDEDVSCSSSEGSSSTFFLALCLFVVGALINTISRLPQLSVVPSISSVPGVTAMACGMALGSAILELRIEIYSSLGFSCGPESGGDEFSNCTTLDIGVALVATAVVGLLQWGLVVLLPRFMEWGDTWVVNKLEEWVSSIFKLTIKAAATSVMMLWTVILGKWSTMGVVRPSGQSTDRYMLLQAASLQRTHFFYACFITWIGSIACARFAKLIPRLTKQGAPLGLDPAGLLCLVT